MRLPITIAASFIFLTTPVALAASCQQTHADLRAGQAKVIELDKRVEALEESEKLAAEQAIEAERMIAFTRDTDELERLRRAHDDTINKLYALQDERDSLALSLNMKAAEFNRRCVK